MELFPTPEPPGLLFYEKEMEDRGFSFIAGVDEAGRGPLAGPVVAAAVIIHDTTILPEGINDSKKLTASIRAKLKKEIEENPNFEIGIGIADNNEIDDINILNATHLAMKRAVEKLKKCDICLIDGLPIKGLHIEHKAIVKGDSKSLSIAAASIIAKETRDEMMIKYAEQFPEYSFEKHKGYGTKAHTQALNEHGPCKIHRFSFAPVREASTPNQSGDLFNEN